jgi:hypothetical protein
MQEEAAKAEDGELEGVEEGVEELEVLEEGQVRWGRGGTGKREQGEVIEEGQVRCIPACITSLISHR